MAARATKSSSKTATRGTATAASSRKKPAKATKRAAGSASKSKPKPTAAPRGGSAKKATARPKKAATGYSFGRAGTAGKGEGEAAVRAFIAGVKPEQRELVALLDRRIEELVPGVQRAVKWSMPMYGLPGQGWLIHVAPYKEYVAVGFFGGTGLKPQPPEGESGHMRRINLHAMEEYDERQMTSWIQQAAKLRGWGKV